jgi:beta-glucosidase
MPGPTRRRGKHVVQAVEEGLLTERDVNECVGRILELAVKVGKSKIPDWMEAPESAVDVPEFRRLLRHAASEGIVLLKNEGQMLPLQIKPGAKMAFIGPNAGRSVQAGGGSSNLEPHYRTVPFEAMKTALAERGIGNVDLSLAPGLNLNRYLPLVDPAVMMDPVTSTPGFHVEYWANMTHSGQPVFSEHRISSYIVCYDGLPPVLMTGARYSYRAKTILSPKTTGRHVLSLSTCGPAQLLLDGTTLIDIDRHWRSPKSTLFMSYGSPEETVEVCLEAGRSYEVELVSVSREPEEFEFTLTGDMPREEVKDGGRIGFREEVREDLFAQAVDLAASSDLVVMVVGKDADWESETSDMPSMHLPLATDALVSAVLAANPCTVVVNQTGSAVLMPWLDRAPAVVQTWYQGQERANALCDVLLGARNPCGKLPVTFPRRLEDSPSHLNYPGGNDRVVYGEGIFVGYKYYDHMQIEPLFPFGFGLSYTTFGYSNMRLGADTLAATAAAAAAAGSTITASVDVTNTGPVAGKEIVQFYVAPISAPRLARPRRELRAWAKVLVEPGRTETASATLDFESVCYWDDRSHGWVVDPGAEFEVIAAAHARDPGISASFSVVA